MDLFFLPTTWGTLTYIYIEYYIYIELNLLVHLAVIDCMSVELSSIPFLKAKRPKSVNLTTQRESIKQFDVHKEPWKRIGDSCK